MAFIPPNHKSLFRQLLSGFYDAVLITDPNGHILEINPRAVEYFGYEDDEAVDYPVGNFVPGVTSQMVQRIRKGLSDDRHVMLDANCQRKDGTSFPAEVTISLIDLVNPGDLVFTVRNVERRRRQNDVYKSKENAFNMALSALFVCGPDGRFRQANRAFCDMFSLDDAEAAVKRHFADLFPAEPLPKLFERALGGETAQVRVRDGLGNAGGEVEVQMEPDVHGKSVVGVVGSVCRV